VFAAFADPKAKARWQDSLETEAVEGSDGYIEFDFRKRQTCWKTSSTIWQLRKAN
jgi:hypothetical protein